MSKRKKPAEDDRRKRPAAGEIRKDLQDPFRGKDLSYLNEMPQMGGYEGVKAGVPPRKEEDNKDKKMADES